jgi:ubiquinol-cytochrome c reductase cytochrome b subunit
VVPPLVYLATKRVCLSLQRADDELLHHGIESGTIRRLPSGEFVEETVGLPSQYAVLLATTPERKELLAHQAEGHGHAPALAGKQRGFFRPRGGVLEAPAPSSQDKQLEGTVD